jgi:hypothetical protein
MRRDSTTVKAIQIDSVVVPPGTRKLNEQAFRSLQESINELGLLQPILVDPDGQLIAGRHRLSACKALGWERIPCQVLVLDEVDRELAALDENLQRAELSRYERASLLARRKELWEQKYPETRHGGCRRRSSPQIEDLKPKSFAADTAERTGMSRQTVERATKVGSTYDEEQKEVLESAGVGITDAYSLAQLAEPERRTVIEQVKTSGGQAVKEALQSRKHSKVSATADTALNHTNGRATSIEVTLDIVASAQRICEFYEQPELDQLCSLLLSASGYPDGAQSCEFVPTWVPVSLDVDRTIQTLQHWYSREKQEQLRDGLASILSGINPDSGPREPGENAPPGEGTPVAALVEQPARNQDGP